MPFVSKDPFVSYAQNFEDVLLWRALKGVSTGFYIDVGAGEPKADSVTHAFYERGWRGINVEPSAGPYERLRAARPEDINLNVAVGAEIGQTTFHVIGEETGLSTVVATLARAHAAQGWTERETTVPVTTLAAICAQYVKGPIHFLKIDVEGAELDVLRGADFSRWRPWIVLLEAVAPDTLHPFHEGWDDVLSPAGYRFAHFDGLNRFYVADEHEAAVGRLISVPVNVLDDFVLASERETAAALDATEHALETARAQAHAAREQVEAEAAQADAARAQTARLERDLAAAQAASEAREAELRDEMARVCAERDGWAQELFETNRHSAQLTVERQRLLEEVAALQHEAGWHAEHQRASAWAFELEERLQDALARLNEVEARLQTEREAATERGQECERARAEADLARAETDRLAAELAEAERVAAHYRHWVERIYASTSWKASRPLRLIKRVLRPNGG